MTITCLISVPSILQVLQPDLRQLQVKLSEHKQGNPTFTLEPSQAVFQKDLIFYRDKAAMARRIQIIRNPVRMRAFRLPPIRRHCLRKRKRTKASSKLIATMLKMT